jgi:histidinol phosphatase-like enzyme
MLRAVFVRRDGIILHTVGEGADGRLGAQFYPAALDALRRLAGVGLYVVVVGGAGEGWSVCARAAEQAYVRMGEAVEGSGGRIAHVYGAASYRGRATGWPGPLVGPLSSVACECGIDLGGSYVVGDTASDVEAARALGCRACYLVLTGRGRTQLARCRLRGERDFQVAFDLSAAAEAIVARERSVVAAPVPVLLRESIAQ